jgi:superfamily I DNA and/or RNA helicase
MTLKANLDFDVTIIDEAGQIQVHNALVPMSVSNKLIMLGDHKQIPPTADQELMDLCVENGVKTELLEKS